MQRSLLVKPNLKLILLGALLIAVLHDVFTSGKSEPYLRDHHYRAAWVSDGELVQLVDEVAARPNSAGYLLISQVYEKRGDMRKAMFYIQKAVAIERLEEPEE